MRTTAKEMLRWVVIAASGGYGLWQLIEAGRSVMRWNGSWFALAFGLIFCLVIAAPFLAVAYLCLRRQYRKLFVVLGVVGCILIFVELSALPERLGMCEFVSHRIHENHDYAFLALPFGLLLMFGPIYAAAWFYRLCYRLAYPGTGKKQKTRATRRLVWLGVLCVAVLPMLGMLVTLNHMIQSPKVSISPESISDSLHWIIGWSVIGSLLVFLGLVHRQPVRESKHETSSSEAT